MTGTAWSQFTRLLTNSPRGPTARQYVTLNFAYTSQGCSQADIGKIPGSCLHHVETGPAVSGTSACVSRDRPGLSRVEVSEMLEASQELD